MSHWVAYPTGATVVGDLRVLRDVARTSLGPQRDILVHLPAGALDSGRRYPVLYMHDGQNLFDPATSFSGEWEVDETLNAMPNACIVIGIDNGGLSRMNEYNPNDT